MICPNCNQIIDKVIKAKSKCPLCGKYIHYRTDPETGQKVYLTDEQTQANIKQWELRNIEYKEKHSHLSFATYHSLQSGFTGFDRQKIDSVDIEIIRSDIYNAIVRKLNSIQSTSEYQEISMLYSHLAFIALKQSGNYFEYLKRARYFELLKYKDLLPYVMILTRKASCLNCSAHHGRIMTIADAIYLSILPVINCVNDPDHIGYCNCMYIAGFQDSLLKIKQQSINSQPSLPPPLPS